LEETFDDRDPDEEPSALATTVIPEKTKSILTTNDSPDIPFDVSINPYKGCEHGCTYCFARQTHAYLDLSPGLDFETKLFSKPEAAERLRQALASPRYQVKPIAIGTNTDPYQPVEQRLGITRQIIQVLHDCHHPLSIVTKSASILRDLDLLAPMAQRSLVEVYLSITTLDPKLARAMEPRAAAPHRRLQTLRQLSEAGVPVGVLTSPMIPGLNDHELEAILMAAAQAGARRAAWILLRLPHEVKDVFLLWLAAAYPDRYDKVVSLLRQSRGGKLYDSDYSQRQHGTGVFVELLERRFQVACRKLGITAAPSRTAALDCSQFRPPGAQRSLFE
jgi:DNA repair photolyase